MGSSRPNCARRLARTSGGTFGLVASSSKGSPGASARITNSTRLIPARTGIAIRRRRIRYFDMRGWRAGRGRPRPASGRLPLVIPVLQRPEVRVPRRLLAPQPIAHGGDAWPPDDGHRDDVLDHQIVHPAEESGPLHRVPLARRRAEELVLLLVPPAAAGAVL